MKTFNEFSNDINKTNAGKAIRHDWATHIYHPRLGEFKVESHSLDEDGTIEEYYVVHEGKEFTLEASKVKVTQTQEHKHLAAQKKKKVKKWYRSRNILLIGIMN